MARKFLYLVAILIVLGISGLFAFRMFGVQIMRAALVPGVAFEAQAPLSSDRYRDKAMWIARPDIAGNPALWTPAGASPATTRGAVAVFYIHPTSYLNRAAWNAPLHDAEADERAELFLRGQVTAFNTVGDIWAPRYRQATFGAFLTTEQAAHQALDLAYQDVVAAFDEFLREVGPSRPIMLVGHSQGSLHLARLLKERIAGTALQRRIVAAYVVGWPISRTTDLPLMGLPECRGPTQAGCILSWQSFAEPADPAMITDVYDATTGFNGQSRRGTPMICTNPLTGAPDSAAPASANLGTLVPSADLSAATLIAGKVPARCDGRGFLLIGGTPEGINSYVLPGNNYHVFDYSLFWANVRADAARRVSAFGAR
ncbi:DUF3089 domain-containing protein [Sphingomonas sp. GlSt437]|uniref:DUF3089 domain-containing protein n=1 Tax=Sphingomonas sp. GlSt437 TaxID=3389970 RepID=UPI003A892823